MMKRLSDMELAEIKGAMDAVTNLRGISASPVDRQVQDVIAPAFTQLIDEVLALRRRVAELEARLELMQKVVPQ